MIRTTSSHPDAQIALDIVTHLQDYFVSRLDRLCEIPFAPLEWFRDEGRHGGGVRYEARDESVFNRASVNISQVHYDDMPEKKLSSASAISTIIHPSNPHAPSMHMHISWTQLRDGKGYWRIMADLNPAIVYEEDKIAFDAMLRESAGSYHDEGVAQGERYFFIPALKRHRGVSHFYLEQFHTDDQQADANFARAFGEAVIDSYIALLQHAFTTRTAITHEDRQKQLDYHTLYFFQVLTLDRGTTSGLLIHNQNDIGILASLPSHVERDLLESWRDAMPQVQQKLLDRLLETLEPIGVGSVSEDIKRALALAVREHYKLHPQALSLQASGDTIPTTVDNHN